MKKIKLGLLGAGICANQFHLPALLSLSDHYELVAMAGANEEQNAAYCKKAGIAKAYTDYQALIQDPNVEAVISSYPYAMNESVLQSARQAGKHILVEKPVAESVEQGFRCASLDNGATVMGVAENWLYWNVIDVIRAQLTRDAIGEVQSVQLFSYYNIDLDNEYLRGDAWRRTATGGMILDRTIHTVALARSLFGPVARATGLHCGIRNALGKADTIMTLLEYECGLPGSILNSASAPGVQLPYNMILLGKRGTITVQDAFSKVVVSTAEETNVYMANNGDGGYRAEFLDFHSAITSKSSFRSDLKSACNDLFAVLTALEHPGEWQRYNFEVTK